MIPGLSVFWVIAFVLLLAVVLDRLLFKPIVRVMGEREARVKAATDLAGEAARRARAAAADVEARTAAAQAEVYRQMDETRRAALEHRHQVLHRTRDEVDASIQAAVARVAAQAEAARAQLDGEAQTLAGAVASRVLGRKVP